MLTNTAVPTPKARRTRAPRETPDMVSATTRMIRACGKRAAFDVEALPLLVEMTRAADTALADSVRAARTEHGYSWTDIGRVLGISRQAAQQRFSA